MNIYLDLEETRSFFRHIGLAVAVASLIGGSIEGGAFINDTVDGAMLTDTGLACVGGFLVAFSTLIRARKTECPSP